MALEWKSHISTTSWKVEGKGWYVDNAPHFLVILYTPDEYRYGIIENHTGTRPYAELWPIYGVTTEDEAKKFVEAAYRFNPNPTH